MPAPARELDTLAVTRNPDGFAVLSFVVPDHGHNVLTQRALEDLAVALDELCDQPPRGMIVRSGRPGSFFAGADLARLERLGSLPGAEIERICAAGCELFARLSARWPSVAVIDAR